MRYIYIYITSISRFVARSGFSICGLIAQVPAEFVIPRSCVARARALIRPCAPRDSCSASRRESDRCGRRRVSLTEAPGSIVRIVKDRGGLLSSACQCKIVPTSPWVPVLIRSAARAHARCASSGRFIGPVNDLKDNVQHEYVTRASYSSTSSSTMEPLADLREVPSNGGQKGQAGSVSIVDVALRRKADRTVSSYRPA